MDKAKRIIINAFRREKEKERGLKIIIPNIELSEAHIKKARHNLIVMDDLNRLGHTDWVVIVAYYAMYHGATAILVRIGLDSKDHATTVSILEYFFSKHIDKELLEKFNELREKKEAIELLIIEDHAKEFILKIRTLLEKLDEDYVKILVEQIKELQKESVF